MRKKIGLFYKKNNTFNNAVLSLDKILLQALDININEKEIFLQLKKGVVTITKGFGEEKEVRDIHNNIIELSKNIKVNFSKLYKDQDYYVAKLNIPFAVVDEFKLTKDDNSVNVQVEQGKITLDREVKLGKIYTMKVNKGGIGKTFLTVQLAHGLSMQGKRVLILTSDSQNNIFDFSLPESQQFDIQVNKGLRSWVMTGKGDKFTLRKNLDFIPLESSVFTERFLQKLPLFLETQRKEYDYILIDSIPTMKIDSEFVKCSDKIVIPAFCDIPTLKGIINVIEEAGIDKILGIVVNLYRNTVTQKNILDNIRTMVDGTGIVFPEPIKEISQIETLVKKGKTIWESKAKSLESAQNSLLDIILEM